MSENLFSYFFQETFLVTQIFKCLSVKKTFIVETTKSCYTNLEMIENTFVMYFHKKNNKTFDQKKI